MNGVWQSRCSAPGPLEPPPEPGLRSSHRVRSDRNHTPDAVDPAVCPSGSGTRLQSELRGFDSRHGLWWSDQAERQSGTPSGMPPVGFPSQFPSQLAIECSPSLRPRQAGAQSAACRPARLSNLAALLRGRDGTPSLVARQGTATASLELVHQVFHPLRPPDVRHPARRTNCLTPPATASPTSSPTYRGSARPAGTHRTAATFSPSSGPRQSACRATAYRGSSAA
ncbi:hypothetical protein SBD_8163 [Streptomyces bottropensis ATCC 25435]|uniref:Uncharacterized protein n=1 Tax=Streptomyces bottropensis ATCC 25435 TaxID=1054862 RepID=M3FF40_9ACTN|nr:hypothetical protein SBD_8163 [Streptomyces bottropensis ATCC 25435]